MAIPYIFAWSNGGPARTTASAQTRRAAGIAIEGGKKGGWASFKAASANYRVWLLFVTYGACFGIEIFIHNIAAVYYVDHFGLRPDPPGHHRRTPAQDDPDRRRPQRLAI